MRLVGSGLQRYCIAGLLTITQGPDPLYAGGQPL